MVIVEPIVGTAKGCAPIGTLARDELGRFAANADASSLTTVPAARPGRSVAVGMSGVPAIETSGAADARARRREEARTRLGTAVTRLVRNPVLALAALP